MMVIFGRKKISVDAVVKHVVATTLNAVEQGWPEVAGFINDSPEFETRPNVNHEDYGKFLLLVIAGNFNFIPTHFDQGVDKEIIQGLVVQFSDVVGLQPEVFAQKVKEYRDFISRVSHPSKNTLYGMSRAVFYKYNLNHAQEEYFRGLNVPNPIFQKNLSDLLENFIWDWKAFQEKFRVIPQQA
ncbi:MAG: hypothetical protein NWR73_11785 [Flavobacteriales bacterium]|jgi:hypothetical protein|nr:hypothetical protein [Flavobacteriales bacterium]